MPNAPLIYVLAQIRFTNVPRMDKRWEDFHEKIFALYPETETERIEQITIKDGQPTSGDSIKRWHLANKSGTTGIIMDAGMLIFHTADYKTSDLFLSDFQLVLEAFKQILPHKGVSVSRLGLRYADLLLQEEDLVVDQQVIETLRLPVLPNIGQAQRMEQFVTYQTPINGTMVIRHRQSSSPDVLSADIFPNKLAPASRLKRERIEGTMVGLLDYDHFIEQDQSFDIETIIASFRKLHDISSAAFKATTTKDAIRKWEKEVR
jgi:uncharacterized protein (TIGR04255 family)